MAKFLQTVKITEDKETSIRINLDHVIYATAYKADITELTFVDGQTILVSTPLKEIV